MPDVFSETFWIHIWQDVRDASVLQTTQKTDPSRWLAFYDNVSTIWLEMMGDGWHLAENVSRLLRRNELVCPGKSALDIGCGPGALAITLAERGIQITALDTSRKMLDCLISESRRRGVQGITPVLADWSHYTSPDLHDLVVAVFFPPAMTPSGIEQMERLSKGCCALITGCGKDAFPIRRLLWHRLMDDPPQQTFPYLSCTFNYLLTTGRSPNVMHLSWPITVNLSMDTVIDYYRNYFAIFGKSPHSVDEAIRIEMADYVQDNRCLFCGKMEVALIWWQPKHGGIRTDDSYPPVALSCWHF